MFRRILVPIDLAEPPLIEQAINHAESMAHAFNADIRLANVQSVVPIAFLDYLPTDFDDGIKQGLETELAKIASGIQRPPETISTTLLYGPVYQQLLLESENWQSDMILLCSHRPAASRYLIGSNASAIVRHASCSVLVLR